MKRLLILMKCAEYVRVGWIVFVHAGHFRSVICSDQAWGSSALLFVVQNQICAGNLIWDTFNLLSLDSNKVISIISVRLTS